MRPQKPEPASNGLALSIGLYVILAIIAFFPCLFQGQAYFDNDLLAQFGPWRFFLKDQLAQGHFPLWNPYLLGGQPFFADLQNMMLYPLNYLTLPFSVPMGLSVFFFLHMILAATGMHLWLRSLGLSENACRVGALLFSLSNFFWLEIIHPPVLAAFAWLPWLLGGLERLAKNPRPLNAFLAGFCFAMLFLCGSFQMTVGAFYGGLAYFLFRCFQFRKSLSPLTFSTFTLLTVLFLWGALPLLGQFVPTEEFSRLSDRRSSQLDYAAFNAHPALEPSSLHQFLFPRLLLPREEALDHAVQEINGQGKMPWAGNWGYVGVWVPLLFLWAFQSRKGKLPFFLAAFLLAWLAVALGPTTPLHYLFCRFLPGFSLLRVPYRFLFLYVLAACALAAMGFEQGFPGKNDPEKSRLGLALVPALAGLLLIPSLAGGIQTWRETLALLLGLAAMGLVYLKPKQEKAGSFLFQAALALPLLLNGWADFIPGPASNFDFVKNSKSLPQIAQEVRPYRVIFGNRMLYPIQVGGQKYVVNYPQDASVVFPMKNFGGYNPLALQSKKDLARIPLDVAVELGALKGILSLDGNLKIQGFKPVPFLPFFLYEYQKSLSYVFAPKSLLLTGQELDWLQKPGFDAAQSAVFSNPLPGEWTKGLGMSKPLPGVSRAWNYLKPCHLQYQLTLDGVDVQRFEVALDQDRVVVFAEAMFPGWKAWVDGQPAPLSTADHILRALHMTAGHHEVEFRFEPAWWTPIRVGLALWLLITLIVLLAILRKNFFAILQKIYYSIGGHGLGRIKLLRWAYDTLFKLFKPKSVMVQGHRMWLDDKDTLELAVYEVYEPVETGLLKEHLKPGQVFVDIGANIGYYTLLATRIVGPKGKVYAFEPDPTNFTLLQKNISTNGYTNVVAANKALSNKAGTAKLYINPSNRGDHRIYDSHDGRPSVEIAMTTVDEYFKKLDKKVHFIKMDIQGAEAAALAGMKGLIRKNKGLKLVTEFSPGALKAFGADPQRYLKDLAALGFRFLEISEKKKSVKPVTPAQLLKRKWGGSEDYTNLFCVKNH